MSEKSSSVATTKDLKRVLGFKELFFTAIGQIIGGGIMSLTGVAIARSGHSVPIAFILSAIIVVLITIPRIILCGTIRMRGGEYTMIGLLAGEKFAGVFIWLHIAQNIAIAMYALSFADYFLALFTGLDRKLIAIVILTLFYLLNLLGIDKMAKAQNWIVGIMCASLAAFCAFGITYESRQHLAGRARLQLVGLRSEHRMLRFCIHLCRCLHESRKGPYGDQLRGSMIIFLSVPIRQEAKY